jgi:hydrogenase nickel incorporation protein HypA/HybF
MHELAIADNIVNTVLKEMDTRRLTSVSAVAVRVGALTDIVPESLEFGFDVLIRDTRLASAKLVIERVPVKGDCRACGKPFEVNEFVFVCSECGSVDIDVTQGMELDIAYLEVEDGSP